MMGDWTFFSNYGHVLVCLAKNHDARLRDVAAEVGVTERAVQKIVRDLQDADIVIVTKQGRCNRYRINKRKALRHPLEANSTVGQLLSLISRPVRASQPAESQQEQPPVQTSPAAETELAREPASPARPAVVVKPATSTEPVSSTQSADTRQQGSLF